MDGGESDFESTTGGDRNAIQTKREIPLMNACLQGEKGVASGTKSTTKD